ncbi:hypothetical protein VLK31_28150 [Variovorax sp. H27-G14]|uniref:hypothetical protein n=1 Tax=Variovorax sp. H27-G14 TaxID=3111914 RepID=UPI0038FC8DD1
MRKEFNLAAAEMVQLETQFFRGRLVQEEQLGSLAPAVQAYLQVLEVRRVWEAKEA